MLTPLSWNEPNGEGRIVGLGTEGSQRPAKPLHAMPTPGASTDHGYPQDIRVQSCTGTQESLLVQGQVTARPRCPPTAPRSGALQN